MKCLPYDKLPRAKGNVLHDWHAEILALRGFQRWLLDECRRLISLGSGPSGEAGYSPWVRWRRKQEQQEQQHHLQGNKHTTLESQQPIELAPDVSIHLYISEAPCGDASMELTMSSQADASPWPVSAPSERANAARGFDMLGRGHFDQLGVVRRKPARPDAPVTLSKSCSDKLAMRQCTGLVGSVVGVLVHPGRCYLESVVVPRSQLVEGAWERAFGASGRMKGVAGEEVRTAWQGSGYHFKPFSVMGTNREFEFSRRSCGSAATASNVSALWTAERQEVLINGVLQGRKQFDPLGASCVSRRRLWDDLKQVSEALGGEELATLVDKRTYGDFKGCEELFASRKRVKRDVKEFALKGWKRNDGDEDWSLRQ